MRLILTVSGILVLIVLACGCIQSPSASPAIPAGTSAVPVVPADTTMPTHPRMVVNVSVEETTNSVIIRVDGGNDAAGLSSLNIRITNLDGTTFQRTVPSPVITKPYVFTYRGYASATNVNIVGTFSDGYQQTLLMKTL